MEFDKALAEKDKEIVLLKEKLQIRGIELACWKVSNQTEPAIQRGVAKTPMVESVNVIVTFPASKRWGRCDQRRIPCLYLYSPYRNKTSSSHKQRSNL